MEELLSQAFSTGDLKIIVVSAILYLVIKFQRNNTGKKRDEDKEDFDKRISLLENEVDKLKSLNLDARLSSIETSLEYIKMLLEHNKK